MDDSILTRLNNSIVKSKSLGRKHISVSYFHFLKVCHFVNLGIPNEYRLSFIDSLKNICEYHFENRNIYIRDGDNELVVKKEYLYSYDLKKYDLNYKSIAHTFVPNILQSTVYSTNYKNSCNKFNYIVSVNGEMYIYNIPKTVSQILSPPKPYEYPNHAILAGEHKLEVIVAGEISFLWDHPSETPDLIIVNNISGHFRPLDWTCQDLGKLVKKIFKLSEDKLVIAFANNGCFISKDEVLLNGL